MMEKTGNMKQTMKHHYAKTIAFGGVSAALAVAIGCIGGIIPVATYVVPMVQCIILQIVFQACGKRIAWSWFASVVLLNALMCPDKEAAAVFLFLGYYPIIKPRLDSFPLHRLCKAIYFCAVSLLMYSLLIYALGLSGISREFAEMGTLLSLLSILLGTITFLLLDIVLGRISHNLRRKSK